MSSYYPVFLKIEKRKCVVVGGGQVALRKVNALLEDGAIVAVVSPEICPELEKLSDDGKIVVSRRAYKSGDIAGALIAIAATDDRRTNLKVSKDARKAGVLVNVVDDAESSDFIVPSSLRRGDIAVAVSTAGKSPALARKIRTRLEDYFGEEYGSLANLIEDVRAEVKGKGISVDAEDWQKALDLDLLTGLLRQGNGAKARAILLDSLSPRNEIRGIIDAI
ncbi:MAG: bifunctional precorrin-2 dehydrogenase/sirohydrochlorin ferrochelatase [Dehalococcoidales bacterium]|nr:bifunctional precorrin-2 dehydrogenase/sirohydrochlorin ferrochelatase [Dehalococcoidales bacterium]